MPDIHTPTTPARARSMKRPGKHAERLAYCEAHMDDPNVPEHLRDRYRTMAAFLRHAFANAQRCYRCGRQLSDPTSIERGYGPECAAKVA